MSRAASDVAELLLRAGVINEAQRATVRGDGERIGWSPIQALVKREFVSEALIVRALSEQLGLPAVDLRARAVEQEALRLLPGDFCVDRVVLPFAVERVGRIVDVAVADPTDLALLDEIRVRTRCTVRPHLAEPSLILGYARMWYFGDAPPELRKQMEQAEPAAAMGPALTGQVDVVGLKARVESLEKLPERLARVEQAAEALRATVEALRGTVEAAREAIARVERRDDAARAARMQKALDALSERLAEGLGALDGRVDAAEASLVESGASLDHVGTLVRRDEEVLLRLVKHLVDRGVLARDEVDRQVLRRKDPA